MQVLAHKQLLTFINQGTFIPGSGKPGTPDYVPGQYEGGGGDHFTLTPKANIQTVPDWIRESSTFKHAVKAGLVYEVAVLSPEPVADPEPPKPTKPVKEVVTGLSGSAGQTDKKAK